MSMKENAQNKDTWLRGLFIIVFGVIFYVLYIVIWLTVILQFLTKVLTGDLNANLSSFSESLTRFAFQILLYITFQSEERPFPFSPWPENNPERSLPGAIDGAEDPTEVRSGKSDSE
ncbi:MAG: DUF4389 domain-containing protein [Gammaproteobacteria bacterium]|nr:DUF4389 domain-containing protein [Gammaproteobacteria bacterium]